MVVLLNFQIFGTSIWDSQIRTWSWRSFWYEKINTPKVRATKTMPKSMLFHQNSNRYSYTKSRHAEGKCIKQHTEIDDFLCTSVDFGWFLTRFSTPVRPCHWCAEISGKNHISVYKSKKPYQKMTHFSKWRLQNDDVMETQSIFKGSNSAESSGWLAGPVGGF